MVDGLAVLCEEVLEFVGSKVCLGGNARHAITSSQPMSGEMETCSEFFMASKIAALEHCKNNNLAGFSLEFECLNDDQGTKGQHCELGSCCQNGLQRYLCEGLEMSGTSMEEMATVPLERNGEGQMVWPAPTTFQNLQVGGHGGGRGFQVHWKCRRFCGISPQQHWEEPCLGRDRCLGDPSASGTVWSGADGVEWSRLASKAGHGLENGRQRVTESERFDEHSLLLSLYEARHNRVWMSSWYSAGYGWLVTCGSEN